MVDSLLQLNATPLLLLLTDDEWDTPFFKKLARNDTASATGHQGGFVVPKAIRAYFPVLDLSRPSATRPTVDTALRATLYIGARCVGTVTVRYQLQTWSGTRSAESRVTQNLGPVREPASEGDYYVLQRHRDSLNYFRIILIKRHCREFADIAEAVGTRPWGPLWTGIPPATETDLRLAQTEMQALTDQPFSLMRSDVVRIETRQSRVARNCIFPMAVRAEYSGACCVSGIALTAPSEQFEVEAAHIVPVSEGGTDDVRNGLALTRTLHWAFDRGMFGIDEERTVHVPRRVLAVPGNAFLRGYHNKGITEAKTHTAHREALRWHMANKVRSWD